MIVLIDRLQTGDKSICLNHQLKDKAIGHLSCMDRGAVWTCRIAEREWLAQCAFEGALSPRWYR